MGRQTHTAGTTRRRAAGVLLGLVLAAGAAGVGTAWAVDGPLGCPAGYTLDGGTCRNGNGGTVDALLMLPGDRDPQTGEELLPVEESPDPGVPTTTATTTTAPPTTTTTTTAPPTTTTVPPTTTTTTAPPTTTTTTAPPTTTTTAPPVVLPSTRTPRPTSPSTTPRPPDQPCLLAGQAPDPAAVVRTQAAVDRARALLVADVRRGASATTLRADAASVVSAVGEHARTVAAQRPCAPR